MKKQKLSIFVKFSIFTSLIFLFAIESQAQSIFIFDVETSAFPIIKAKIYAFDKDGQQQRPNESELKISENGINRKILSVTCPNPKPIKAISSVLVMDISGSMSGGGSSGIANIDLVKQASTSWINALPTASSQCAITSFDNENYYIQDFTTDKSKLLSTLNTLAPLGGTDYDAALLNPMAGGIPIAKNGKYKKVVIIITDGMPNQEPQVQTIIKEANSNKIMIFAVTLGMPCPDNLKQITTKTGGFWYENVTTIDNARQIYYNIMNNLNNSEPCEITWESDVVCKNSKINLDIQYNSVKHNTSYETTSIAISSLQLNPNFIFFGKCLPSTQNDKTIRIFSLNEDFTIKGINRQFGSPDFSILNTTFPIFIPKNTSKNITLRFTPNDSSMKYASFEIETDQCNSFFSANGGFPNKKSTTTSLKLTQPNGGESFVVGSDTVITWTGVSPTDTVSLEYSIDKGSNWNLISNKATDLKYNWKNVPKPSSKHCLARVKQATKNDKTKNNLILWHSEAVSVLSFRPDGNRIATASKDGNLRIWDAITGTLIYSLTDNSYRVNALSYSPDGSQIATASLDYMGKIWDANTGTLIHSLTGHTYYVNALSYNANGSQIATASLDNTAKIWNVKTGTLIHTLFGHTDDVLDISFSPDSSKIATASVDSTVKIWDAITGTLLYTLSEHSDRVNALSYSPDGSQIATVSNDNTAKIWDANTGKILHTLSGHTDWVNTLTYSPDGSQIATVSNDNTAKIWDANTGKILHTLSGHTDWVSTLSFSPDGSQIATASKDNTAKIWDVNSGRIIQTLIGHTDWVSALSFSPDGSQIATSSNDGSARIWELDLAPSIQEDQSDAVFSIVTPEVQSKDIDMKKCLVASAKDSVISNFIENIGSYKCRIDSIYFRGADASAFSLVSGFPQYTIDATKNHNIEIRFKPTKVGIHNAEIVIITQADTLFQKITGSQV